MPEGVLISTPARAYTQLEMEPVLYGAVDFPWIVKVGGREAAVNIEGKAGVRDV